MLIVKPIHSGNKKLQGEGRKLVYSPEKVFMLFNSVLSYGSFVGTLCHSV